MELFSSWANIVAKKFLIAFHGFCELESTVSIDCNKLKIASLWEYHISQTWALIFPLSNWKKEALIYIIDLRDSWFKFKLKT